MADTMKLVKRIAKLAEGKKKLRLMEVCGTHTVTIFRSGIRQVLPENVELVSGLLSGNPTLNGGSMKEMAMNAARGAANAVSKAAALPERSLVA